MEVEEAQRHVSAELWIYRTVVEYAQRGRRINTTNMTKHWEDWCTNDFLYLVQTPVVVYLSPST
jgi:7-keto-8-aminopelargonate synthetase-like enzyme